MIVMKFGGGGRASRPPSHSDVQRDQPQDDASHDRRAEEIVGRLDGLRIALGRPDPLKVDPARSPLHRDRRRRLVPMRPARGSRDREPSWGNRVRLAFRHAWRLSRGGRGSRSAPGRDRRRSRASRPPRLRAPAPSAFRRDPTAGTRTRRGGARPARRRRLAHRVVGRRERRMHRRSMIGRGGFRVPLSCAPIAESSGGLLACAVHVLHGHRDIIRVVHHRVARIHVGRPRIGRGAAAVSVLTRGGRDRPREKPARRDFRMNEDAPEEASLQRGEGVEGRADDAAHRDEPPGLRKSTVTSVWIFRSRSSLATFTSTGRRWVDLSARAPIERISPAYAFAP